MHLKNPSRLLFSDNKNLLFGIINYVTCLSKKKKKSSVRILKIKKGIFPIYRIKIIYEYISISHLENVFAEKASRCSKLIEAPRP